MNTFTNMKRKFLILFLEATVMIRYGSRLDLVVGATKEFARDCWYERGNLRKYSLFYLPIITSMVLVTADMLRDPNTGEYVLHPYANQHD